MTEANFEKVVASINHSSFHKTGMNDFFHVIENICIIFYCFVIILAFDRRTDGRTFRSWLYRVLHYIQSHGISHIKRFIWQAELTFIPNC